VIAAIRRYFRLHAANLIGAVARASQQPTGTVLTVLVIAIALALPAGLRVFVNNADSLSEGWEGAADFTVYLDMEVGETRAAELANEIAERSDVAATSLISRAQALAEFRVQSGFGEALDALQENPLPHTLVVRPAFTDVARVQALAGDLDTLQETALVQIDTEWVARLQSMLGLAARSVDIATALLGLAVVLVIGNTIRLEINNRRIEIEVMKLVGGSDGFIRRPFLYLGFCYGLAGAATAAILIFVALALIRAPVRELAELYASTYRLAGLSARETFVLLGGGAVLGWLGAWLAAARHLRQIGPS
jgi:cell division transport system permease protein